jgi:Uma2 family endonuclease
MTVVVDPSIHRMNVEEYEQFVANGDLDDVELIDGVVYDVSPEYHLHAVTIGVLSDLLRERYGSRQVLTAGSVRIDERSLWNPDVYVLDVGPDFIFPRYSDADHVLLAVEVSLTTWSHDIGVKLAAHARNGIPEYWVVDPRPDGRIIRHREPLRDAEPATYDSIVTVPLPDGPRSLAQIWDAFEEADGAS